ncbi:hypothetical protein [Planctomicrobium sp. SH527]|uniref:hypothetical protein n=1 Tax=Planctomicrobium sp. SH527 TaxID=3448123 RepID=UPI003F5C3754
MGTSLSANISVSELTSQINETKAKFFHCEGGWRFKYEYSATIDRENWFAFSGPLSVEVALLWPKYRLHATGTQADDNRRMNRVSVYDFVEHQTVAIDQLDKHVFVSPDRHMFSSGFSSYLKMLQWAEGDQNFRLGSSAIDFTVPECFAQTEYKNRGEEVVDGVRCIHLPSPDDDIWIAFENGYFVKRRETRYPGTSLLKSKVEVVETRAIQGIEVLRFPWIIQLTEFVEPDHTTDDENRILRQFELRMLSAEAGTVSTDEFNLTYPPGALVEDLLTETTYYQH